MKLYPSRRKISPDTRVTTENAVVYLAGDTAEMERLAVHLVQFAGYTDVVESHEQDHGTAGHYDEPGSGQ